MDTLGNLIDKLNTVSLKMWWAQENIYEVRRISFQEFREKYIVDEDGAKKLYETIQKACDLNIMRNQLINEIDAKIIEMVDAKLNSEDLDNGKFIQRAHKTY